MHQLHFSNKSRNPTLLKTNSSHRDRQEDYDTAHLFVLY